MRRLIYGDIAGSDPGSRKFSQWDGNLQQGIGIHPLDLCGRQQVFAFIVSWLAGSFDRSICGEKVSFSLYDIRQVIQEDQEDEGSRRDVGGAMGIFEEIDSLEGNQRGLADI